MNGLARFVENTMILQRDIGWSFLGAIVLALAAGGGLAYWSWVRYREIPPGLTPWALAQAPVPTRPERATDNMWCEQHCDKRRKRCVRVCDLVENEPPAHNLCVRGCATAHHGCYEVCPIPHRWLPEFAAAWELDKSGAYAADPNDPPDAEWLPDPEQLKQVRRERWGNDTRAKAAHSPGATAPPSSGAETIVLPPPPPPTGAAACFLRCNEENTACQGQCERKYSAEFEAADCKRRCERDRDRCDKSCRP